MAAELLAELECFDSKEKMGTIGKAALGEEIAAAYRNNKIRGRAFVVDFLQISGEEPREFSSGVGVEP